MYTSVLAVVDVAEVNVIMGAGMDSLVVDVVEVNVIMGAGMHSVVSCFAVTVILQLWCLYGCYDRGCTCNMKMLRANREGCGYMYERQFTDGLVPSSCGVVGYRL